MSDSPSTTAANGRKSDGRFSPGNTIAKGNPFARRVARLRSALFKAVTPEDLRDVVSALLAQAKAGDVSAAKELLQRLLGPPLDLECAEKLDALERTVAELQKQRGSTP